MTQLISYSYKQTTRLRKRLTAWMKEEQQNSHVQIFRRQIHFPQRRPNWIIRSKKKKTIYIFWVTGKLPALALLFNTPKKPVNPPVWILTYRFEKKKLFIYIKKGKRKEYAEWNLSLRLKAAFLRVSLSMNKIGGVCAIHDHTHCTEYFFRAIFT